MKKEWKVVEDYHANSVIDIFEHAGYPVIVHRGGKYPSATDGAATTRDHPYIDIALYESTTKKTGKKPVTAYRQAMVVAYGVYINGRRRNLTVWDGKKDESIDYCPLLEAAMLRLDEAAKTLSEIDHIYDIADSRIADGQEYKEHFMSRTEYEAACAEVNVPALSDEDCQSYGVRYGDFRYPQYDPDHIVKMHMAYLRMCALDEAESEHQPAQALRKTGQLWEPCEVCGKEPVYMPLMLCSRCWPK